MNYVKICLLFPLTMSGIFGVGITNYETILPIEKAKTLKEIKDQEKKINKEIDELQKTLKVSQKCLIEQVRATLAVKNLAIYALRERKVILMNIEMKKRTHETQISEKTSGM